MRSRGLYPPVPAPLRAVAAVGSKRRAQLRQFRQLLIELRQATSKISAGIPGSISSVVMKTEPLETGTRRDGPFPLGLDEVVVEDTDVIRPSNSRSSEARRL